MRPVVGIICEYDPFHLGHARQFSLIRKQLPGAAIVCVMSGPFTQRGMPALYSPSFRANAALHAGAALVLELPCLFAVREAENFAVGSVSILHRLGFVTHISFGCETENLALLWGAASLLEMNPPAFQEALHAHLQKGMSFAKAHGLALAQTLAAPPPSGISAEPVSALLSTFSAPNNILAVSYLRALRRLQSGILPLPVLRDGHFHETSLATPGSPSATAVRTALLMGDTKRAETACGYSLPPEPICAPVALDTALLYQLRQMTARQLAALPDCTEGLENRLLLCCRKATSRAALLAALKTKRYPHARLNRLCTHGLLGITAALQAEHPAPSYVRLLGFRTQSAALLHGLRQSGLTVIAKAADGPHQNTSYQLDMHAYDLWALGAQQPAGMMLREPVQIVRE